MQAESTQEAAAPCDGNPSRRHEVAGVSRTAPDQEATGDDKMKGLSRKKSSSSN